MIKIGTVLGRGKLSGLPGRHDGIVIGYQGGQPLVFDFHRPGRWKLRSLDDFLQGRNYWIVKEIDPSENENSIMNRAQHIVSWCNRGELQYKLRSINCEAVANYVHHGVFETRQGEILNGVIPVAFAVGLIFVVKKLLN